ncbi:LysR substrate-binding domain-containing protein [Undibacterium arcticum]|uniref:LysR substrate-binding domain-containing protein n=1 Tax=Undibacterium arcticum TaxID=1762892 RepID=A0ABV7EZ94_9BURK
MDRFDTMLAFTRVVELASFTKSAVSLNLPKATVSAQVLALEKRLRVKLLNRTTRHVSVTPDGAAYYERAVRLLSELEETEDAVRQATTAPKGRLRVDVPGSIGRRFIVPALPDFFARYPEIDLEVGCTDRPVDLLQEGVDCVIRGGEILDDSLVARRLGNYQLLTCATPAYLEKYGTPATLADLERHALVNFFSSKTGKIFHFEYMTDGIQTTVRGLRRISLNDADACIEAGLAGLGIVQMPTFLMQDYVASGRLRQVLDQYPSPARPFFVLYPQNRHLSSKVRAFVEWAAALFASCEFHQAESTLTR